MSGGNGETVWIQTEVYAVSEGPKGAVCVEEVTHSIWIPKSQISDFSVAKGSDADDLDDLKRLDVVKLELPRWIVERKGLEDRMCEP